MTFYKIIAGNGRTYVTSDEIEGIFNPPPCVEWRRIRTVEGKIVYINLHNIAAIEVQDEYVREPSEIEQIVGATLNGLFGKPKQIDTIDLGEKVE